MAGGDQLLLSRSGPDRACGHSLGSGRDGGGAKPNIMLTMDDSGSMNEQRTPDHAGIQMCYDSWDDGPSNILEESSASANRNDNCRLNDPPLSSPDIKFQYYNFQYIPIKY